MSGSFIFHLFLLLIFLFFFFFLVFLDFILDVCILLAMDAHKTARSAVQQFTCASYFDLKIVLQFIFTCLVETKTMKKKNAYILSYTNRNKNKIKTKKKKKKNIIEWATLTERERLIQYHHKYKWNRIDEHM